MRINPDAYTTRPAIIQAAKNNAYYIGRLKQHLDDFDKDLAEWKASGEWKKDYKTWGLACEVALEMTRGAANNIIRRYKETSEDKSGRAAQNEAVSSDSEKAKELAKVNNLPNLDDLLPPPPATVKGNGHMTGKAVKDTLLENGESTADYKRPHKTPTHSGKPIYAMPAWKELEEFIGKAINRTDAVNHLLPNPKAHRGLLASLKDAFTRAQSWHEEAKHA